MEWATVGGGPDRVPHRFIVDDCWNTWSPTDPAEYAWHGHVLFFEDPVQHAPEGPTFVPTGLLPGQSDPDLAYYLNVWAASPSPFSGYKGAHSTVFSGEWEVFLDFDDSSSLPSSTAFDVAVLDATASRTQPSPAASRASYLVSGSPSHQTEYFDLINNDCDECLEFQNEQVFNNNSLSNKVFQALSKLRCRSRRASFSNEIDWMESSDNVMDQTSVATSFSVASCDMLKKPFLQHVRSFLSSIYGVPSQPDWSRCANFLRRRSSSQLQAQDDGVAAHGSLEAHDFGAVVDAGDSRQAGCHGLHRQEELGVEGQRPGTKGAQLQGQEDVGQEPQQDSHHSGHRQAIAALHFAEDLACGSHEMQSSSRVHAMQSQSTQQMVGLPGMWKPLATADEPSGASSSTSAVPECQNAQRVVEEKTGRSYPEFLPAPRSRPQQGNIQLQNDLKGQINYVIKPKDVNVDKETKVVKTEPGILEHGSQTTRGRKVKQVQSGLRPTQRSKTPTSRGLMEEAQELVASDGSWEEDIPMTVPVVNLADD